MTFLLDGLFKIYNKLVEQSFLSGPPEAPKISGFPRHKTIREGDDLSLDCISEVKTTETKG
jgi:hypothetical protein